MSKIHFIWPPTVRPNEGDDMQQKNTSQLQARKCLVIYPFIIDVLFKLVRFCRLK